uniref:Uncharacterized protein n=1 Tax=Micrurus lemniscatus lemniscatus TaxID=129467 RepID=A0A2D4HCH3_MICLE
MPPFPSLKGSHSHAAFQQRGWPARFKGSVYFKCCPLDCLSEINNNHKSKEKDNQKKSLSQIEEFCTENLWRSGRVSSDKSAIPHNYPPPLPKRLSQHWLIFSAYQSPFPYTRKVQKKIMIVI